MILKKQQAIQMLAIHFDEERQEGETDIQLVLRIRNMWRGSALSKVDNKLKSIARDTYFKENPESDLEVEDLD